MTGGVGRGGTQVLSEGVGKATHSSQLQEPELPLPPGCQQDCSQQPEAALRPCPCPPIAEPAAGPSFCQAALKSLPITSQRMLCS